MYPDSIAIIQQNHAAIPMITNLFSTVEGIHEMANMFTQGNEAMNATPENQEIIGKCDVEHVQVDTTEHGGDLPEMKVFVVRPKDLKPDTAMVFFHGGGFIGSSPSAELHRICFFADLFKCIIFAPDYGPPIDHPSPACALNGYSMIKYVHSQAQKWQLDPSRVAMFGESHGGHQVAVVSLELARRKEASLVKVAWADIPAVSNRWLHMSLDDCNWVEKPTLFGHVQALKLFAGIDLDGQFPDGYANPDVFPTCVSDDLVKDFPNTFVSTREFCFFKKDAEEYAELMKKHGKLVKDVYVQERTVHASAYLPGNLGGTEELRSDQAKIWKELMG